MQRREWLLFLGAWCAIALLTRTTPHSAHEYSRLGTVESIVERGTYRLDDSTFIDTLDKIHRDGHFYSHQAPLLATLEAPVYALLRTTGARFNNSGRLVMTYAFSLLTNGIAFALTVIAFAKMLELAGAGGQWRSVLACVLPMGTWLLPYATVANNHGISASLLAWMIYLLMRIERGAASQRLMLALGAIVGLLVAIELLPLVSFAPLVVMYLYTRREISAAKWTAFAAAAVIPLLMHAAINIRITGDIIPAGFHHELFDYPGSSFTAASLTGTVKHASPAEFARYAWSALFSGPGYFTFAPLLLIALIAGVAEWKWWGTARGLHLVLLGGSLSSVAAALLTTNNLGGAAVGFRHGVYAAPAILALLLPWLVNGGWQRGMVAVVAAVSALSMLLFAVPAPWAALTVERASTATLPAYSPIIAHLIEGTLLKP